MAWAVAAGMMAFLSSGYCLMVPWMFPLGFPIVLPFMRLSSDPPVGFLLFIGWLIYGALTIYGLRENRRARYFVVYSILCVFLFLNVCGCYYLVGNGKDMCEWDHDAQRQQRVTPQYFYQLRSGFLKIVQAEE